MRQFENETIAVSRIILTVFIPVLLTLLFPACKRTGIKDSKDEIINFSKMINKYYSDYQINKNCTEPIDLFQNLTGFCTNAKGNEIPAYKIIQYKDMFAAKDSICQSAIYYEILKTDNATKMENLINDNNCIDGPTGLRINAGYQLDNHSLILINYSGTFNFSRFDNIIKKTFPSVERFYYSPCL